MNDRMYTGLPELWYLTGGGIHEGEKVYLWCHESLPVTDATLGQIQKMYMCHIINIMALKYKL